LGAAASSLAGELMGFVSVAGNTVGGGNAAPTKVTTFAELEAASRDNAPRVLIVFGTIKTEGGAGMRIGSNKTIMGADKNPAIHGGLSINSVSNVILRNFNLQGIWSRPGPDDAIAVRESHHVWIDHLNEVYCDITARGNIYNNCTGKMDAGRGGTRDASGQKFPVSAFDQAPYSYTLDKAEDVPGIVSHYAGPQ
jgi:pectate lyase